MPLTRYQIRNEYSLADPELYKAADRDDPEALLEGVDMAGLIGVLRQLGDLAEFAAEIFHDLHEEVMATAARGHGLMVRVQQIEAEFPSIEKALLLQTNHSSFYSNAGVDWHPNLQMKQNLITRGDLPRCVMDSYEECRGPPRLFLLDKFDVAGAGACLKRYTDPSLFKVEAAPSSIPSVDVQREKRIRKAKKKGSRWRNGETPEITTASHAKLHELFLVENIEKSRDNPARLVKLKKRQLNASPFDPRSGKSYMEKFLESPMERNAVREISVTPLALKMTSDNSSESGPEIHDISTVSPVNKSSQGKDGTCASPNARELVLKSSINESYGEVIDRQSMGMPETLTDGVTDEKPSIMHKVTIEKEIVVDGQGQIDRCLERDRSDDMISEVDNYMDALATMESEMETDNEYRSRTGHGFSSVLINGADSDRNEENMELQANSWDSHSIGNYSSSDDGNSSLKKEKSSFSYSDTRGNLAENAQSDGEEAVHVAHSETCTSEILEMHSNHPPVNVQIPRANSQDLVLSINRCMDENNIHDPEVLKPSDYCSTDSSLQQSDSAASAEQKRIDETLLHQFNETQSVCTKPGSELSNVNESAANLVDSSAVYALASEGTKDDSLSAVCAASYPLDKLDGVLPDDFSDALLHDSNNSEMVPAKQSSDHSVGEELHTDSADEKCAQNMVNYQTSDISSPLSTATPREEQSHLSALPESEVHVDDTSLADCSDVVSCDNLVFQSDNSSRLTRSGLENLMLMVDTSDTHNFKEEQLTENLPHARPDSLEQAVLCSKNQANLEDTRGSIGSVEHDSKEESLEYSAEDANFEDASRTGDAENISLSTSKVDEVEADAIPHELPSSSPARSTLESNVDVDDVVAGSVQSTEITVVSNGVLANTVDEDCKDVVCQPLASESSDLMKIPEFANAADDQRREEVEVEEPFSSEHVGESEVEKKKDDPEVVPSVFPFTGYKLVSNEDSNSEMVDCTQDPALVHTTESNLNARDISTEPAHSELSRQLNCPHPEDGGDTMFSPTAHLPVPETSSDQLLESQFDQSGLQDLEAEKAKSKSPDDPYHIDQESRSHDASEFSGNLPTQPSASESLPQLTLQETSLLPSFGMLHEAPQVSLEMPPLPPLPPMQWRVGKTQPALPVPDSVLIKRSQESFPLLLSLEQDETKKFGYPGPHGGDLQPGNPFLPLAAAESDKSENMSETVVGNIMQTTVQPTVSPSELPSIADDSNCQHPNSSLELSELPDEEPEHDSSASEKEVVQSSSNLLLPDSSKENTALKGDTVSLQKTESHSPNQLASETGLEDEVPKEASGNLERDHVNTCNMSVLPPRKVEEQPQHCLEDEVLKEASVNLERDHDNTCDMSLLPPRKVEEQPQHCLEDEVLKEALLNLERDHDNTCDMSVLPPRKVEEQPQHGLLTSGGESAWPENPFVLLPTSESGKPNGSSVTKIPRPRNPLIDAVAAHDKSKLRKVTERVLPQSEPKVDERDSLLEQIRTKSFNLKRAVVTRPSMPGPTPNLKLAAILEKANAIRHATAGSDEDDSDSWSDS